jgi:hypothetical protein
MVTSKTLVNVLFVGFFVFLFFPVGLSHLPATPATLIKAMNP